MVYAIRGEDGHIAWDYNLNQRAAGKYLAVVGDELVVITSTSLLFFHTQGGLIRRRGYGRFEKMVGDGFAISGNILIFSGYPNKPLRFFDLPRRKLVKTFSPPGTRWCALRCPIASKNMFYISDVEHGKRPKIYAFDTRTFEKKWEWVVSSNAPKWQYSSGFLALEEGRLYFCKREGVSGSFAVCLEGKTSGNIENNSPDLKSDIFSYPNPFNPECYLPINAKDKKQNAKCKIYNILGQLLREIEISNLKSQISQCIYWDGRDSRGLEVPAGVYFYEVTGEAVRKMVVLR
jgi:hypothetical protein